MKFVKENLTVVICAVVAVLLIVAAFVYPIPGMVEGVKTEMNTQLGKLSEVKSVMNTELELPGKKWQGVPSDALIEVKKEANDAITKQKDLVEAKAIALNSEGRITAAGVPLLPMPTSANPNGAIELVGYLPKLQPGAVALKYKTDYAMLARLWTGWLAKGTPQDVDPGFTTPPTLDQVMNAWDEREKVRLAQPGIGRGAGSSLSKDSAEGIRFQKQAIANHAADIRMYVDRDAFQVRAFARGDNPPTEQDIFESLVDSWLQSDVVKAIITTNGQNGGGPNRNITNSSIKRLTRIVIGNNARTPYVASAVAGFGGPAGGATATEPGFQFFMSYNAQLGLGGAVAMPVSDTGAEPTMVENAIDYTLGMTGRSGGATYDVVLMSVVMDIDPSKINTFIDHLYKRNMGYTVINMNMKTVDPLERASTGYLYGDQPAVELELLIECMFYRGWLHPLMPETVRRNYGLPTWKPPETQPQ